VNPVSGCPSRKARTVAAFDPGDGRQSTASETGVPRGSVGPTLQRLRERGLVRHREPYWAVAEDDRIATYESMLRGMEALADDDAWSEVDAAEHTVDESELAEWRERADGDDG
jgi:hypothetical protein